jgi:DyP dimeric alpha+beta barrel domain
MTEFERQVRQGDPPAQPRSTTMTTVDTGTALDLADIQAATLRPRPSPYAGAYILLRIDERDDGRELLRRLIPAITTAAERVDPATQATFAVALTHSGLRALGVPRESLDSFPVEFRHGMAARAELLGDVGDSAPEHWEQPLGSPEVHIALAALAPDADRRDAVPDEHDPLVSGHDQATFTVPRHPIRRKLTDLPGFVTTRGGEYCFQPGLRALRWIAELDT